MYGVLTCCTVLQERGPVLTCCTVLERAGTDLLFGATRERPMLVGPAYNLRPDWLVQFLKHLKPHVLDAVTYHLYMGFGGSAAMEWLVTDVAWLDSQMAGQCHWHSALRPGPGPGRACGDNLKSLARSRGAPQFCVEFRGGGVMYFRASTFLCTSCCALLCP
eukprot:749532-Rhodomonas_salina.2